MEPSRPPGGLTGRSAEAIGDAMLADLARDGDERAFELLAGRYRAPLRRYCLRLGVPGDRAEDVLQQAFLDAWAALRGGVEVRSPRAWLYRIVHNLSVDDRRDASRTVALPEDVEVADRVSERAPQRRLEAREALAAVAALPTLQREAIVRTSIAGESYRQVGGLLGVSEGAVRGLTHRARLALRGAPAVLLPPLQRLLPGRSPAAGGMRESLVRLAAGAGSAGTAAKASVVLLAAATAIATAGSGSAPAPSARRHASHASSGTVTVRPVRAAAGSLAPASRRASSGAGAPGAAGAPRQRHSRRQAAGGGGAGGGGAGGGGTPQQAPLAAQQGAAGQAGASAPAAPAAAGGSGPARAVSAPAPPDARGRESAVAAGGARQGSSPSGASQPSGAQQPAGGGQGATSASGSGEGEGGLVGQVTGTVEHVVNDAVGGGGSEAEGTGGLLTGSAETVEGVVKGVVGGGEGEGTGLIGGVTGTVEGVVKGVVGGGGEAAPQNSEAEGEEEKQEATEAEGKGLLGGL